MKKLFKISLLIICILFSSIAVIYSTSETDSLKANEYSQIRPTATTVDDETYLVLIFTSGKTYLDLFEFEAGNKFKLTSEEGNFTGEWEAVDILELFTYFTAKVEEPVVTTTTTTASPETTIQTVQPAGSEFLVNIWGFVITIPPFGVMIGGGTYLGADAYFIGLATRVVTEETEFGSIEPEEGEQGETLQITITGKNTKFEQAKENIKINMGEDIDIIGGIGVESDTELNAEIKIAEEAKTGLVTVVVTYDGTSITGTNKFTILKKTD